MALGDSLLDFLHIHTSPALLYDAQGRLLYVNKAAEVFDKDASAIRQIEKVLLPGLPARIVTRRGTKRASPDDKGEGEQDGGDQLGKRRQLVDDEIDKKMDTSRAEADPDADADADAAGAGGMEGGTTPTGREDTVPQVNGQYHQSPHRDTHTDTSNSSSSPTPQGTTLWKITQAKDTRIVVMAQDSIADPLPELQPELERSLHSSVPIVNLPWQLQHRFHSLKEGGGEMGSILRSFNWAAHPLGPIETWPQARVELVSVVLRSPIPSAAYLEKEAYVLYNDAYRQVMGPTKHPHLYATPASVAWGEIFHIIEEPIAQAMRGISIEKENQLLFFDRLREGENNLEEIYATWYYIPYWGQDRVIGNMHVLFEAQARQNPIALRRINTLADLSASLSSSRSTIDLCRNALDVFSRLEIDLPYCLAYTKVAYEPPELATPTADGSHGTAMPEPYVSISSAGSISSRDVETQSNIHVFALQETVGCAFDSAIAPSRIVVDTDDDTGDATTPNCMASPDGVSPLGLPSNLWQTALAEMTRTGEMVEVTNVQRWLTDIPHRGLPGMKPYRAVLVPLKYDNAIQGCLILLLNPALPFGSDFKTFLGITARQINLSLNTVKMFEQEVQRAEELAALDRAKTSFFTSISHELRTPLTLILGPIKDLTADATLSRSQHSAVSLAYRNACRLLRLVNSILDFARAEAGKLSSHFAPTRLGEVTMELASSFRSAIESAGMRFITENRAPEDTLVWVDMDKWEKIVFNLISNAFKFTTQGQIRVSVSADSHYFYLEVQDTGIGIPPDELSSIFERFVRVENPQARSIEGSGIGLSLTLELVKAHGGKIGVESVWHKGSTFRLKLPLGYSHLPKQYLALSGRDGLHPTRALSGSDDYKLHTSEDISTHASTVKSESVAGTDDSPESGVKGSELWPPLIFGDRHRARVLLVDDNADLRLFIAGILNKYCDVEEAYDGQMGWKMLQERQYDMVLSDIMMPRWTGFQLLAAIRADARIKTMPVILLSARAGEDAGVESLSSGADDHLNKPFSSKELILRVHSHLQLAAIRTELELRVSERTAALEESKSTFQRLSELLQVGVHRSDIEGNIVWANRKWFQVLGIEQGTIDNWAARIHPEDVDRARAAYRTAIETGEGYSEPIELRLLGPGDVIIDITYELQAEQNAAGDCIGFVGVFTDVSVLRKLERERVGIEQARREEAENNRQLQEHFIDVTCHELRNPLNAISNSAELLGESLRRMQEREREWAKIPVLQALLEPMKADLQEDMEAVETILLSSRHQKRIADDVLHVSKISGNLVTLAESEWQPELTISNTLKMFSLEVASKSIDMQYERDPSLDFLGDTVIGDEGRFTQVCVNLLSNAIKFLDSAPTRRIRVRLAGTPVLDESTLLRLFEADAFAMDDLTPLATPYGSGWSPHDSKAEGLLHFAIQDTGPGMNMDEQARIFKRYAQASPKTYREFGGVGLGLWISRRLVELHGGAVALQSVKGEGTVFRLYIKVQRKFPIQRLRSATPIAHTRQPAESEKITQGLPTLLDATPQTIAALSRPLSAMKVTANTVRGRRPRILVVEDNDINLKVLVRLLTTLQCDTVTAGDGAEAIVKLEEKLKDHPWPYFDLIFMDLEMPIMDGLTATQNIRAAETDGRYKGGKVSIVAVSANARQLYADLSAEAGMNGFLRKPYSKTQLLEIVNEYVHE